MTSQDRSSEIRSLCSGFTAAIGTSPSMTLDSRLDAYRLSKNGLFPHEFSRSELCAAHVGLFETMILWPSGSTYIVEDHGLLWAWDAELLVGRFASNFSLGLDTQTLRTLELALLAASMMGRHTRDSSFARYWLLGGHYLVYFVAFPLLERLLKRRLSHFVDLDGTVLASFTVRTPNGKPRRYGPKGSVKGASSQISSLRDLLILHHENVATPALIVDLDGMIGMLPTLDRSHKHGFDVIYSWRNSTLHGDDFTRVIAYAVLMIALRLLLEGVPDYDQRLAGIRMQAQMPGASLVGDFYPP